MDLPVDGILYDIEEKFGTLCDSWKDNLHDGTGRFGRTRDSTVLYRSHISEELLAKVEQGLTIPGIGILIEGPPGVGKSHSLDNLVLKL
jgi:Cdc6-like AAA superfamily ATPase